jgi:predicted glycoside hydrolase/deacetylase ChbG (UPF0249 family)
MSERVLIPHIDDVAGSHGANVAMVELGRAGVVTSGSVMVPPAWFPELAAHPRLNELDLGIHLTLTSESKAFRWRPISTASRASGLLDDDGYMWPTVPQLRRHAHPDAVEAELRAQVDMTQKAGIDVTHLDHHMGAALSPEFVEATVRIASDYRIPLLFPSDLESYLSVLEMGGVDVPALEEARRQAGPFGFGNTFLMGLTYQLEPDCRATFERLLTDLPAGVTYLSLHCASPGDVEQIHPHSAQWRVAEYELFSDPGFLEWMTGQPFKIRGLRLSSR